jgi:hypothetical protein
VEALKKEQGSIVLKLGLVALAYLSVLMAWPFFLSKWVPTQTAAVILTGLVIIWYTMETHILRRETQRQTEIQQRPFIIIKYENQEFILSNIGNGPAFNVKVKDVNISSNKGFYVKFPETLSVLIRGDSVPIKAEGFVWDESLGDFLFAHLDPEYANQTITIEIHFQDMDMKQYTSKERILPGTKEIIGFSKTN